MSFNIAGVHIGGTDLIPEKKFTPSVSIRHCLYYHKEELIPSIILDPFLNKKLYNLAPKIHNGYISLIFTEYPKFNKSFDSGVGALLRNCLDISVYDIERGKTLIQRNFESYPSKRLIFKNLFNEFLGDQTYITVTLENFSLESIGRTVRSITKYLDYNHNSIISCSSRNLLISSKGLIELDRFGKLIPHFMLLGDTELFPDMLLPIDYSKTKLVINNRKFAKSNSIDKNILKHIESIKAAGCTDIEYLSGEEMLNRYVIQYIPETDKFNILNTDKDINTIKEGFSEFLGIKKETNLEPLNITAGDTIRMSDSTIYTIEESNLENISRQWTAVRNAQLQAMIYNSPISSTTSERVITSS